MPIEDTMARAVCHARVSLSRLWDADITLGQPDPFGDGYGAYRVPVESTSPNTPDTVVFKVYELEQPARHHAFCREAAGWTLLEEVSLAERPLPEYYGCDPEQGYVILEDLRGWEKVSMLLRGDWSTRIELGEHADPIQDREIAEDAIKAHWCALGRLHAATAGHETRHEEIQASFDRDVSLPDGPLNLSYTDTIDRFRHICEAAGVSPLPGSEASIETSLSATMDPPFRTFLHGDPAPANALYHEGRCKLIDFEDSRYGGALSDAVHIHTGFHTSWCAGQLPDRLKREADKAFRAELSAAYPGVLSDDVFYGHIAEHSVVRVMRTWRHWTGKNLMQEDITWGRATVRQRFLSRLERAVYWTAKLGYLNSVGATFARVLEQLKNTWPASVHTMPSFPAFTD